MKILCSTGAFISRLNGRDYTLLMRVAPQLNCDGLEFMMYDTWYEHTDDIVAVMRRADVLVPVLHVDKQVGEKISRGAPGDISDALHDFVQNCRMAWRLGAKKLVLHLWNGRPSDHEFSRNLQVFGEMWKMAQAEGLLLTVENVVCGADDPLVHFQQLRERYPAVRFTYDTKMAAFHSQQDALFSDDWAWLWEEDRIAHLHLNDYGGGYRDWERLKVLHPGEGWLDLSAVCAGVRARGYDGTATSEASAVQPDGSVDVQRLNRTLRYYAERLKG